MSVKKPIMFILQLVASLWVTSWKVKLYCSISLLLTLLIIACNAGIPLVLKYIITLLSEHNYGPFSSIPLMLLAYGGLWTVSQIMGQVREITLYQSVEQCIYLLSLRIFNHLHSLSMRFHFERKTGEIVNVTSRAQIAFGTIVWGLLFIVPTVMEVLLAAAVLSYFYGFLYSFLLLVILISYTGFSMLADAWTAHAEELVNEKEGKAASYIVDSLLNAETVKYFNNQQYEHKRCEKALYERQTAVVTEYTRRQFILIGQGCIIGLGLTILTWLSGKSVMVGTMNVSDFVLINGYILQFVFPLMTFSFYVKTLKKNVSTMNALLQLLAVKPEIIDMPGALTLKANRAEVIFDDVSFSYDERRSILHGVSLTIPAGKTVAIVGATGAGKSTISRLMFRLYDVTDGRIFINGHDIRTLSQASLRQSIGIVPQDTVLFNDTIYHNILYGRPDATSQEVEHAARLARLDTFIASLPDGYQTIVGERGLKLSGGEKQRVAIARTILKQPLIYIFDEATSSLDTATEREIQRNLEEISFGATTLIIAHRLSTVVHADEIIVLNQGRIVERGTHQALLDHNNLYAGLWRQQARVELSS